MLIGATYDGIKAFQINASYNDLSNVSDTLREDVNAAISTFMQSLAMKMGIGGNNINHMVNYIPAVLFTLYDGYYIYSPTKTDDGYEYMLKPYNYYTVRYKKDEQNDIVVNYTLDNYIAVYGWINGEYIVKSGYLVSDNKGDSISQSENLTENIPWVSVDDTSNIIISEKEITSTQYIPSQDEYENIFGKGSQRTEYLYPRNETFYVEPDSAKKYYTTAAEFTDWTTKNLSWVTPSMAVRNAKKLSESTEDYAEFFSDDTTKIFNINKTNNNPEELDSIFAQHKTNVIKASIQDNLNQAITAYSQGSTVTYDFKLPKLTNTEWDMVSSNVCMLTFMEGVPMGTKYYNNYALVQSTRNKLYVSRDSLYFIEAGNKYYHKIDCPHLGEMGGEITGFSNFDFLPKKIHFKDEEIYYKHNEQACYYCIVDSNYQSEDWKNNTSKSKAYYTALAREKYRRYTTTMNLDYGS